MEELIKVENLFVKVEGKEVLKNVSFEIKFDEVCVLIGPNGAGKSTLSNVLMGNPKYEIVSGKIYFKGEDITDLDVSERAKLGLFMSFQQPVEISGVTMTSFLRTAYNSVKDKNLNMSEFQKLLNEKMQNLEFDSKFRSRFLNKDFSGGEKKRSEILQFMMFEPQFAILDEIDSGLDVDSLKLVSNVIKETKNKTKCSLFLITHYNKILEYIKPDKVILLKQGEIVEVGDYNLIKKVEEVGFN